MYRDETIKFGEVSNKDEKELKQVATVITYKESYCIKFKAKNLNLKLPKDVYKFLSNKKINYKYKCQEIFRHFFCVSDLDTLTTQTILFGSWTLSGGLPSGELVFIFNLLLIIQQLYNGANMSDKSLK